MVHHAQTRPSPELKDSGGLFGQPCRFVLAAESVEQFPASTLPEVAFIGRSNAGKSTLINALTRQKGLARASNTPGRTQQIVFFNAADRMLLADLPGYGHAKAPKTRVAAWQRLIRAYLRTRVQLRCVVLLVDSRHGLLAADQAMMDELDRAAVNYQVILAKADYLRDSERAALATNVEADLRAHPAARPSAMTVSSTKNVGLKELRLWLEVLA